MLQSGMFRRQHSLQIKEHLRTTKLTDAVENHAGRATNSSHHVQDSICIQIVPMGEGERGGGVLYAVIKPNVALRAVGI